jgi:hypothetical protein
MATLHWLDRGPNPDAKPTKFWSTHTNRPRISAETILKMLTWKAQLMGKRVDVLRESDEFVEKNIT